jgi:gamma-glutamylputrescine oxidase
MRVESWWYSRTSRARSAPLCERTTADVLVVGGGVAGLHAALRLSTSGAQVVLVEGSFCGGGMSGKSSGFLTPDSELDLHQLIGRFGAHDAAELWAIAVDGVRLMVSTARDHGFTCDLQPMDSLFVGTGRPGTESVRAEAGAREALGYTFLMYDANALAAVHPGGYSAGIRYADTWSLDPFAYCQALRRLLIAKGVQVYEDSALTAIDGTTATTRNGAVSAGRIAVCANQVPRRLNRRAYRQYDVAHTVLAITAPLGARDIAALFPEDRMQCWDDRWIYNYYRLTGDDRLLLGGGSVLTTLTPQMARTSRVIDATIARFRRRFPRLSHIPFEAYWPGQVDFTRDLLPIAAPDTENPAVHFVIGCAGLPWAAWCGDEVARQLGGASPAGVSRLLGWDRKASVPKPLQTALGKPLSFAIEVVAAKIRR